MVMRADLAVAARQQRTQHVGGSRVLRHRIGDDVGRPDAMTRKQRVQARQRVDVVELLVCARGRVPLIVAFGVDADQQMHGTAAQRS